MYCKFHPEKIAVQFCNSCGAPLCEDCAEEVRPGVYTCFQCAMLHSVSEVGSTLSEKHFKARGKKKKRRKWGAFEYFLVVSSVLVVIMWGFILFGGQPAPKAKTQVAKSGRVLLFLVDGALKRYAYYEGNRYPESLYELIPRYLNFGKSAETYLSKLLYSTDPVVGYRLSLVYPEKGKMNLVLTAKGIEYLPSKVGGSE